MSRIPRSSGLQVVGEALNGAANLIPSWNRRKGEGCKSMESSV